VAGCSGGCKRNDRGVAVNATTLRALRLRVIVCWGASTGVEDAVVVAKLSVRVGIDGWSTGGTCWATPALELDTGPGVPAASFVGAGDLHACWRLTLIRQERAQLGAGHAHRARRCGVGPRLLVWFNRRIDEAVTSLVSSSTSSIRSRRLRLRPPRLRSRRVPRHPLHFWLNFLAPPSHGL